MLTYTKKMIPAGFVNTRKNLMRVSKKYWVTNVEISGSHYLIK